VKPDCPNCQNCNCAKHVDKTREVLDNGYVRLVDTLGNDLSVINAARVSYDKESTELTDRDKGLMKFLIREGHTSPFRHAALTFEVYAPLFVARQWWKYAVASTHVDDQNGISSSGGMVAGAELGKVARLPSRTTVFTSFATTSSA